MAPSKSDLVKIGQEGFAMLDDYFGSHKGAAGKKQQPSPPPPPPGPPQQKYMAHRYERQPQKSHVYQVIAPAPAASKEAVVVMDCYEAAKLHGGIVFVDHHHYPKAKKPPMRMAK